MSQSGRVLFTHGRVIDGTGNAPLADGAVLVDADTISWVGTSDDLPHEAADATVIDLDGRTVCPGFFDTHVHFVLPGTKGGVLDGLQEPTSYRVLKVLERLRVTLYNGVTTARDLMGVDAGVRRAVAERLVPGPRLLVAIALLSENAGHADFSLPSGLDPTPWVAFPGSPRFLVNSVDEIRTRVRQLVTAGADCIKLATSGGVASPNDQPDWLGLRPEMIAAAVEEAHSRGGRPVAAHAQGRPGIAAAIHGGVTSVEHGYQLDDDELRAEMVARGQYLVPTLLETSLNLDPARSISAVAYQKSVRWHGIAQENAAASVAAGIKIALGTDCGMAPDHGTNLRELGLLVRIGGMTPMQAIQAGTRTAAELCGVADRLGTLEAGKTADLVVLGVDPMADIERVGDPANIHLVVKDGRCAIDRAGIMPAGALPDLVPDAPAPSG